MCHEMVCLRRSAIDRLERNEIRNGNPDKHIKVIDALDALEAAYDEYVRAVIQMHPGLRRARRRVEAAQDG
jgi:hypothetical protein